MKKIVSILALALAFSATSNAQSFVESFMGGVFYQTPEQQNAAPALVNIISGLAGTVYSSPVNLNGDYSYNGIAISVTSSEGGIISNLAGTAVTSGLESKADEYMAKVGIVPGALKFNFNAEDNTFTMNVGALSIPGNYKVGDGGKTVTLTFGKLLQYFCMTGVLESDLNGAKMLFPANKAMAFLKKVVGKLGEKSSQISSIAKLADGYDNYKIGFKLAK